MTEQKPIPIENLSEYFKSLKGKINTENAPVVDVGQIVVPKKNYLPWVAFAMMLILGISSMATYNLMSAKEFTVIVDADTASQTLSQIVSDSGGQILAVKQTEDSTYEIKVSTRKNSHSFLEWLRKNKDVKKAELRE